MASQSESSVSVELGELLELLNALEAQDSRPLENFATLERLLAAGKGAPTESPSDDHQRHDDQSDDRQLDHHQSDDHQLVDYQRDDYQLDGDQSYDHQSEAGFDDGISSAAAQPSSDELIANHPDWREDDKREDGKGAGAKPEAEIENRLAVHIIQGLRKSMKDWAS